MLALFGPEPKPVVIAQPSAPAPIAESDDATREAIAAAPDPLPIESEKPSAVPRGTSVIPYSGSGSSMRVLVNVDGPEFGEEIEMIFDTGATLSTLNRRTLEMLDLFVPPDAPTVQLHTAAGEVQAQLALLDALWIGDEVGSGSRSRSARPAASSARPGCSG